MTFEVVPGAGDLIPSELAAPDPGSGPRRRPSIAVNTLLGVTMLVSRGAVAFAASVIVVRTLGADGRGHVVYVTNLVGLLALVASSAAVVGVTSLRANSEHSIASINTASVVVGLLIGGVLGLGYVVIDLARRTSTGLSPSLIVFAGIATALLAVLMNVSVVASLDNRLGAVTWTSLAGIGGYLVITAVTAATGTMTVANNIAAWLLTSLLPLALLVWPARAVHFSTRGVGAAVRRLLSLTLRANIATTSILAIWKLDQVIVGLRRGYVELGLYSVAVQVAEIVWVAAPAFRSALLPHHNMSDGELASAVARVTRVVLAATVLFAGALAIIGHPLLSIFFGDRFAQTYPTMLWLLPGVIVLVLHYPLFDYIAARRGISALTVMGLTGVALNVGLDYVLLAHFSYIAAAAVSTLTYALVFATCLVLFVRQSGIPARDVLVAGREDVAAIAKFGRNFVRRMRSESAGA